ncbi:MAG: serine/threonine protein kinase [Chloroflexi bacterium]|nr:serine/threonine protein kinase [Chloroflexota bacterium]
MHQLPELRGQVLGNKYHLVAKAGDGGMGAVYRAYQTNLRREVAVKILPTAMAAEPGYRDRFTCEAETAASLEHLHIVPVYDYGTERGLSYVVMRLLQGGSLLDRLHARAYTLNPLPSLGEISSLLRAVANALDYAHQRGVIHCDIKPANIMFDNQGHAVLVDFGIARLVYDTQGTSQKITGTPVYMAPEQWNAEQPKPATDQYSLGLIVYELLAGRVPFEAPTPHRLMYKHLEEPPPPLISNNNRDFPPALDEIINRVLAKEPDERFESCTAFARAFESAIIDCPGPSTAFYTFILGTELPTTEIPIKVLAAGMVDQPASVPPSTPPPTVTVTRKPRDTRPLVWSGVVILLVVPMILGMLYLSGGEEDNHPNSVAVHGNNANLLSPANEQGDSDDALDESDAQVEVTGSQTIPSPNVAGPETETQIASGTTETPPPSSTLPPPSDSPTAMPSNTATVLSTATESAATILTGTATPEAPLLILTDYVTNDMHHNCAACRITPGDMGEYSNPAYGEVIIDSMPYSGAKEFCEATGGRLPTAAEVIAIDGHRMRPEWVSDVHQSEGNPVLETDGSLSYRGNTASEIEGIGFRCIQER